MFNKGKPQGSKGSIPTGGHTQPTLIAGLKLQWKNAQKKEKKNITSDAIKRSIPNLIPFCTLKLWCPSNVASITISLNHLNKKNKNIVKERIKWKAPLL